MAVKFKRYMLENEEKKKLLFMNLTLKYILYM